MNVNPTGCYFPGQKRIALKWMVAAIGMSLPAAAMASKYIVPFDSVEWQYHQQADQCILQSADPRTGFIVKFILVAAQPLSIKVEKKGFRDLPASVLVETTEPVWGGVNHYSTTTISNLRQQGSALIGNKGVSSMLDDMAHGAWFGINMIDSGVYFPTTNFIHAYEQFTQCRFDLPPVNFQHARQVELLFQQGVVGVNDNQKQTIKDISSLVKKDPEIIKILIDGYTDNLGDPVSNLQLSKQRGSDVAQWFIANGVSKKMIEIRGHGDRYPKYDNKTVEGRDKNRRVEIRLVRQ
ncbi:OmpA family protein [Photobacterium sp. BZF1]|uniref:OmpA family protein n=1 Tax=Photobacterium sp. BZF1 TaxID=1904457 RepID=UPI001653B05F|nr:OmpA family protein [Photobacterium sp. BZF1]MBC7001607.1 OmpA family protein [Photobacterium sp. BZF1]